MLTRRIAASACTLCLVIPAAAGASPAAAPQDTVKAKGPYGITPATGPQDTVKAKGPYGITPATGPQDTVKAKGPYGAWRSITTATGSQGTVKAKGPYGITTATGPRQDTTRATAHPAGASGRDAANSWRTAAISEAALLAALALGSALLLLARRRPPRLGT
jgi:hypothetical protein